MFSSILLGVLCGLFTQRPKKQKQDGLVTIVLLEALAKRFVYLLEKTIYARDTSKGVGSEARGEGRERGNLIETTSKPPVAQRAGGIYIYIYIYIYTYIYIYRERDRHIHISHQPSGRQVV